MHDSSRSDRPRLLVLAVVVAAALLLLLLAWTVGPLAPTPADAEVDATSASHVGATAAPASKVAPPNVVPAEAGASPVARPADVVVRGRVVDLRTKEPVPELDVHLRSADPGMLADAGEVVRRTTTKADGSFEAIGPFDSTTLRTELYDAGTRLHIVAASLPPPAGSNDLREFKVRIGPTVPVVIAVRDEEHVDPAQWTARIVESALPEDCAGEVRVYGSYLQMHRPCDGCPDREWPTLPLRPGLPPWIRYPTDVFELNERYFRPRIEVVSLERVQRGRARIRGTLGIQPPALVDPLERMVLLEGVVVDEHGKGVSRARVIAMPHQVEGGEEVRTAMWRATTSDALGRFTLHDVAPGRALLCAWTKARPAALATVHVAEGRSSIDEPLRLGAMRRPASGGDLSAHARTARTKPATGSGRAREERARRFLRLRLACTDRFTNGWLVALDPQSDPEGVGTVGLGGLLDGLPAERLEYDWIDRIDRFQPTQRPRLPAQGEIVLPDVVWFGDVTDGIPLAVDTETEGFARTWLSFEAGGALVGCERALDVRNLQLRLAPGADLDWAVWRHGYAPRFGRRVDLVEDEDAIVLRAQLEKGWGAVLWFRTRDTQSVEARAASERERLFGLGNVERDADPAPRLDPTAVALAAAPLPAVRVHADGKLAATSDEEGVARLALAERPGQLLLYAEGWHLAALERLEQNSSAPVVRYVAWMERD